MPAVKDGLLEKWHKGPPVGMQHLCYVQAPDDTTTKGSTTEGYDSGAETAWYFSIEPVRGDEFTLADKIEGTTTYRLQGHYFSGLTQQHRIRWGSRYFNIRVMRSIGEVGAWHELICVESS